MNMGISRTSLNEAPVDWDFASPGGLVAQSPLQPLYDPNNPEELFSLPGNQCNPTIT